MGEKRQHSAGYALQPETLKRLEQVASDLEQLIPSFVEQPSVSKELSEALALLVNMQANQSTNVTGK